MYVYMNIKVMWPCRVAQHDHPRLRSSGTSSREAMAAMALCLRKSDGLVMSERKHP